MSEYCDTHGKHIPLTGGVCPECRIAELEELEDKVKNGFQGGCWCCEIVALKNIELEADAKGKETDDE